MRYTSGACNQQALLSIHKIVNGTETLLASMTVPPQATGTALRASVRSEGNYPGIFARLGSDIEL